MKRQARAGVHDARPGFFRFAFGKAFVCGKGRLFVARKRLLCYDENSASPNLQTRDGRE